MTNKWDFPKVQGFKFYNGEPERYGFFSTTKQNPHTYTERFTWAWNEAWAWKKGIIEIPETLRTKSIALDFCKTNYNCGMTNMSLSPFKLYGVEKETTKFYWAIVRECIARELQTKNLTWLAMSFSISQEARTHLKLKSVKDDPCYGFFNRVFISSSRYDRWRMGTPKQAKFANAIHYYVVRRYSLALELPEFPAIDLSNLLTVDDEEFPEFTTLERKVALKILSGNYHSLHGVEIGAAQRIRNKIAKLRVDPETVTNERLIMGEGRDWG